ncbi:MAG: response regulator transcription factor [Candidatus Nitrotoga sp.]
MNRTIRVTLVDDHRSLLWGLERLVNSAKPAMEVVGMATNVIEALQLLDTVPTDVIVLDLDLSGESGVRAISPLLIKSKAKILVLTGSNDYSLHDAAVLAGARGIVEKASPAESILKAIEKVYEDEMWLSSKATGRIFLELSRRKAPENNNPEQQKIASLTRKERLIAAEVGSDPSSTTTKEIAKRLFISEFTLRNHLTAIYEKLGVANRLELYAYTGKHKIYKEDPPENSTPNGNGN